MEIARRERGRQRTGLRDGMPGIRRSRAGMGGALKREASAETLRVWPLHCGANLRDEFRAAACLEGG